MRRRSTLMVAGLCCFLLLAGLTACHWGLPTARTDAPSMTSDRSEETTTELIWPGEEMGQLPVPKGQIMAVTRDADSKSVTVFLSGMTREQAEDYLVAIAAAGYELAEKTEGDGSLMAHAGNEAEQISFLYMIELQECSLTFFTLTDPAVSQSENPKATWPETWDELPILTAEISDVLVYDDWNTIVYFNQIDQAQAAIYAAQLSEIFTLDIAEQADDNSLFFTGSDPQGRYLEFFWSDDQTASLELIYPQELNDPTVE